jgi:hypothetical protein
MSTATVAFRRPGWIINRREDLFWFLGSSLLGYVALIAFSAGFSVITAFILWNLLLDGPHVWSTTSRTYLDKDAKQRLSWRLWVLFPLLAIGPMMYGLGASKVFFFMVITWAQYHVAKQHIGFVMLYKRKTGETNDFAIDKRFLISSLMLPWAIYAASEVGLLSFPIARFGLVLCLSCYAAFTGFFILHQFQKRSKGQVLNEPKLLLFALVIPLQWLAFIYAIGRPWGIVIAGIATNIGHSFQYLRLTWFHNRNRYEGQTRATIGLAAFVNRSAVLFFSTAVFLHLFVTVVLRMQISGEALISAFAGFNMAHYYLDSIIWRTRTDPELARALRLDQQGPGLT